MVQYTYWWDGQAWDRDDIPIGHVFRESYQRPILGGQVKIKGRIFKVTRIDPADNPADVPVTYYVESFNGNWPYRMDE